MPLFLNNDDVDQLLTMKDTMEALEILYREMGDGTAVTAPRSDVHSPTAAAQSAEGPMAHYLKSMSGATLLIGHRRLAGQRRRHAPREAADAAGKSLDGHRYVV